MRKQAGLTLLELLTVVLLVAILASIAIPNFSKMVEKAKVREAQTTLSMIFQAERIFRLDQGSYGTVIPIGAGSPGTLVSRGYLPNPNPNKDWSFTATQAAGPPPTFTATAKRTGGGTSYDGRTIGLDETFTGALHYPDPPGPDRIYAGNHPLRD